MTRKTEIFEILQQNLLIPELNTTREMGNDSRAQRSRGKEGERKSRNQKYMGNYIQEMEIGVVKKEYIRPMISSKKKKSSENQTSKHQIKRKNSRKTTTKNLTKQEDKTPENKQSEKRKNGMEKPEIKKIHKTNKNRKTIAQV